MPEPNVLIFMTDHQRGDTVLPEHQAVLPNISRFAQEDVPWQNNKYDYYSFHPSGKHIEKTTHCTAREEAIAFVVEFISSGKDVVKE